MRVNFKWTTIDPNSKECIKEYALASAHTELVERFQSRIFSTRMTKVIFSTD